MENKNIMLKNFCRQCHTAVAAKAATCPLCGIARPVYETLNPLEKEYLETAPSVPAKFHYMCETVNPAKSLASNMAKEFGKYLANPSHSWMFLISLLAVITGSFMMAVHIAFPLSFMLFWGGLVYTGFDVINFIRAIMTSFLIRRLMMKTGSSPYSVHFKIEDQLIQMLQSLQMVVNSFFDKEWSKQDPDLMASADTFIQAARTITARIKKYALLSLETASIIWRNNIYAIVASNSNYQEKSIAIANKIREAEAMILRFRWLTRLEQLNKILENHANGNSGCSSADARRAAIDAFQLSPYGPLSEPYSGNFEHAPFEIPFKMRFFWHQQLPPFPLSSDELTQECPQTKDLFESIQQVRKLKARLEEQMILDCTANAVADASGQDTTALEAKDLQRFQLYAKYLDVPKFQPDTEDLQNRIDRLKAQLKV